jgi:dethiobiotin synthetase
VNAWLVSGTDTGVGKTYVTCLLGRRLAADGVAVVPLKPAESGCPPGADGRPHPADAAALRDAFAAHLPLSSVCLYALSAIVEASASAGLVLVEGAGGLAVELTEGYAYVDLARDLALPVLLVAENRLGVLNHLRLSLRCLAAEGVVVGGVVLNDRTAEPFAARESNEAEVRRLAGDAYLGRVASGARGLPDDVYARFRARWSAL